MRFACVSVWRVCSAFVWFDRIDVVPIAVGGSLCGTDVGDRRGARCGRRGPMAVFRAVLAGLDSMDRVPFGDVVEAKASALRL